MEKKAINLKEASFTQAINISAQWCKDWGEDFLSEEVLADRIAELIKTKNGLRGFFAYALSDKDCLLLDKLPFSLIFKLNEASLSLKISEKGSLSNNKQSLSDKAYAKNPLSPFFVLISSAILSAKTSSLRKSSPQSLHHCADIFIA